MAAEQHYIDVDALDLDKGEKKANGWPSLGETLASATPMRQPNGASAAMSTGTKSYHYAMRSESAGPSYVIVDDDMHDISPQQGPAASATRPSVEESPQQTVRTGARQHQLPQASVPINGYRNTAPAPIPDAPAQHRGHHDGEVFLHGRKRPRSLSPIPVLNFEESRPGGSPPLTRHSPHKDDPDVSIVRDRTQVEKCFAGLWPKRFSKEVFLQHARHVVGQQSCLARGEFWSSFQSIEFLGEGSFGFVWRCVTFDGDAVAVKAAPVSYASSEAIDDAFGIIREIAALRCLNCRQVLGLLPLHAAFLIESNESLPPHILSHMRQERHAEAKAQRDEQKRKKKMARERARALAKERAKKRKAAAAAKAKKKAAPKNGGKKKAVGRGGRKTPVPTVEESSSSDEEDPSDVSSESSSDVSVNDVLDENDDERYSDRRNFPLHIPQFFGITKEDALTADATLIMVTNVCDGDLESLVKKVQRPEARELLAEEVGLAISGALKGMHSAGMVHLDLKPANILYRRKKTGTSKVANAIDYNDPTTLEFFLSDFGNVHLVPPGIDTYVTDAIGTYEYMDLMALERKRCDMRTDSYSLGCCLFEILTGGKLMQPPCAKKHQHHRPECYINVASKETQEQRKVFNSNEVKPAMVRIIRALTLRDRQYRMNAAGCYSAITLLTDGSAVAGHRTRPIQADDSDDDIGAGNA